MVLLKTMERDRFCGVDWSKNYYEIWKQNQNLYAYLKIEYRDRRKIYMIRNKITKRSDIIIYPSL